METERENKNKIRLSNFRLEFHQILLVAGVLIFAINLGAATAKGVPKRGCGNSNKPFAVHNQKPKRSVLEDAYQKINETLFVETIIVVDSGVYRAMHKNLYKVHKYCETLVAEVNSLYKPLNVSMKLVDVVVWMDKDEIQLRWDSTATVKNFKKYRSDVLAVVRPYISAQLLTTKRFLNAIGEAAEIGGVCSENSVAINNYDDQTTNTMAHELGHLLGLWHDENWCECDSDACIMHPNEPNVRGWSACSIEDFQKFKREANIDCLRQVPSKLFEPTKCGNKIVDSGEECDCGSPIECSYVNPFCEAKTCKLRTDLECKSGTCCNLATYEYHPAGFDCRTASNECQLPSQCGGEDEICPQNKPKPNNTTCNDGNGFCFDGICQPILTTAPSNEPKSCPFNCSGHGFCDNDGNCVCDEGFALPDCTAAVSEGNSHDAVWLSLNICLFAISLISIFFLGCWYHRCRSNNDGWEKPLVSVDHSNPCDNKLSSQSALDISKRVDQPKSSFHVLNENSTRGDFKTFVLFDDI